MKALIHEGIVRELHETGFPVHESLMWVDAPEGVTTEWRYENGEFIAPEIPQPTPDEIIKQYETALDTMLDGVAVSLTFKDRYSLIARAGYPNKWQQLAIAFGSWMDGINDQSWILLSEVLAGTKPMPTVAEYLALFPTFEVPE